MWDFLTIIRKLEAPHPCGSINSEFYGSHGPEKESSSKSGILEFIHFQRFLLILEMVLLFFHPFLIRKFYFIVDTTKLHPNIFLYVGTNYKHWLCVRIQLLISQYNYHIESFNSFLSYVVITVAQELQTML